MHSLDIAFFAKTAGAALAETRLKKHRNNSSIRHPNKLLYSGFALKHIVIAIADLMETTLKNIAVWHLDFTPDIAK